LSRRGRKKKKKKGDFGVHGRCRAYSAISPAWGGLYPGSAWNRKEKKRKKKKKAPPRTSLQPFFRMRRGVSVLCRTDTVKKGEKEKKPPFFEVKRKRDERPGKRVSETKRPRQKKKRGS